MANLHLTFKEFNTKLNITESKDKNLKKARKALTDKIRDFFKGKEGYSTPKFWTQGSFQMGTTIRTESDKCDLDLGIYFSMIPDVSGETIQKHVFDLVDGHTKNVTPNHKKRCVRVNYAGEFHIDLPVYFFEDEMTHPLLAVKGEDFEKSDPNHRPRRKSTYSSVCFGTCSRAMHFARHLLGKGQTGRAYILCRSFNGES